MTLVVRLRQESDSGPNAAQRTVAAPQHAQGVLNILLRVLLVSLRLCRRLSGWQKPSKGVIDGRNGNSADGGTGQKRYYIDGRHTQGKRRERAAASAGRDKFIRNPPSGSETPSQFRRATQDSWSNLPVAARPRPHSCRIGRWRPKCTLRNGSLQTLPRATITSAARFGTLIDVPSACSLGLVLHDEA
jgi:hypothetical protein